MFSLSTFVGSLIIIPALIYIYCNWRMIHFLAVSDLDEQCPSSVVRVERKLFTLSVVRGVSPFVTLAGIGWGFIQIYLEHGLLSVPMGLFILSLGLGYFLLKGLLVGLLVLLFTLINPKKGNQS